jgi:hypothetical protein
MHMLFGLRPRTLRQHFAELVVALVVLLSPTANLLLGGKQYCMWHRMIQRLVHWPPVHVLLTDVFCAAPAYARAGRLCSTACCRSRASL